MICCVSWVCLQSIYWPLPAISARDFFVFRFLYALSWQKSRNYCAAATYRRSIKQSLVPIPENAKMNEKGRTYQTTLYYYTTTPFLKWNLNTKPQMTNIKILLLLHFELNAFYWILGSGVTKSHVAGKNEWLQIFKKKTVKLLLLLSSSIKMIVLLCMSVVILVVSRKRNDSKASNVQKMVRFASFFSHYIIPIYI